MSPSDREGAGTAAVQTFLWALRALAYHRARSALGAAGIGAASALLISTFAFNQGFADSLKRDVDAMGYQILATGKGCPHEAATLLLRGGVIPMYVPQAAADRVARMPEVADTTRFLMQSGRDEGGRVQLYVGIDDRFLKLKPAATFQRGGWFSAPSADEAILGFNVAEFKRLGVGDSIKVQGRPLVVGGILDKLGTQDDGTVFLPLALSQRLFERRDLLTGIGIRVKDLRLAGPLIERLYETPSLQVVRMAQVQETILGILAGVRALLLAFGSLCLAVALLGAFNVALIAAQERRAELGVLRALGCSRARLFCWILAESFLLGAAGAALGSVLTLAFKGGIAWAYRSALPFVPGGDTLSLTPAIVGLCSAAVILLCVLAGAYPAWDAARTPPSESMGGGC